MRLRWLVIAAGIVAAAVATYLLLPSEERRVRARLTSLAGALSVPRGEADFARLARAATIRGFLADDAVVYIAEDETQTLRGRDAIAGVAVRSGTLAEGSTVEIVQMSVAIGQGGVADARVEGRITAHDATGQPSTLDARVVALTLRKIDGKWLISNVRIMGPDDSLQ